jgi:hypothetical protein
MPELVEVIGEGEVAYEVRALSVSPNATHVELAPMTENENGYGGVVPRILTMGTNKKWGRKSVIGKMHGNHSIVVTSAGVVYAAGYNYIGQLGNNIATASTTVATTSVNISGSGTLSGKTIVAIACGISHTLALDSTGQVHAWGSNGNGRLGNNSTTDSYAPIAISGTSGFGTLLNKTIVAIACGSNHTLALDSTGQVHAWGSNGSGQLGNNTSGSPTYDSKVPIAISGTSGFGTLLNKTIVAIACGDSHTLALDSTGRVHAWGYNVYSQLGSGTANSRVPILSFGANTETVQNLFVNFTGQHRCFVDALTPSKLRDHEGLVVVTDKNAYASGLVRGRKRAMAINQALPLVSLSRTSKDPRAFGVISLTQDHPAGPDASLSESQLQKIREEGDVRVQINSIGEGCIWVCEEGGILKAGDYVTTSSIPGYAMQQLSADDNTIDNTLRNYTVAKLTMDCDFTQPMVDVQDIQNDEYGNVILDSSGAPVYATVLKKDTKEVVDPETGMTKTEELDDVLVPETEPAYDMRWLSLEADGTVKMITKEQYEERKTAGDTNVTRAAFVGCTYHCG